MHSALLSGAREALLYDMLTERDRAADFTRAYGRMRALEAIAGGLAMIAGGALVRYSYQTVLAVSIAAPILSSAVAWIGLTEPTRHGWGRGQQYGQTLRAGLLEAARNRHVLYMVLLSLALLPLVEVLDEYVGPILHEKSFSPSSVAYWFAFIYLLQGWGMASAHRLPQSRPWAVLLIYLPAAGAVLLVPAAGPLGSALGLCVYFSLNGLLVAYFSGRLQKHITGQARATVTSVTSLATALGAIAFYVAYGLVANRHGFGSGAAFLGASTATLALGFLGLGLWWRVLDRPSETTGDGPSGPPPAQ